MVTLQGGSHAHNVGCSLLTAIGGHEWLIAKSEEQYVLDVFYCQGYLSVSAIYRTLSIYLFSYVRIAVELASDPGRLIRVRQGLRSTMLNSPLCNGQGFVQRVRVYIYFIRIITIECSSSVLISERIFLLHFSWRQCIILCGDDM